MGTKVFASSNNFNVITPSDTTLVTCKAIYIGSGGNLYVTTSLGATPIGFINVPSGTILPIELKDGNVMSTDTTASNLINLKW